MEQPSQRYEAFVFSGQGGEYFRIWIVNLCLSLLTLGIYSAWAKVRRMQYFYRHTAVAGASFDYHGDPVAILKGRIIAVGMLALYTVAGQFSLAAGLGMFVLILAVMPWLLVRSYRFRLHNTSYRGLRFSFQGKVEDGYVNFLLMPMLGYITLGLLMPLAHQQIRRYLHKNSLYGDERFDFHAAPRAFYKPYLIALGGFIAIVAVGGALTAMLAMASGLAGRSVVLLITGLVLLAYLGALLLIGPYLAARLQNVIWNNTTLGNMGFDSHLRARGMFGIMTSNFLLILLTLGLYKPYADIRLARYRIDNMALLVADDLDEFVAGQQETASATGEEAVEMFDLDVAI
jgi:uncharacterized membrane protein YjgN (DUF898 family)